MRRKGLSLYEHVQSFVASSSSTTQQTPGGQEEASSDEPRAAANTEVLCELQERAAAAGVSMLVIDSAESLIAYITGPASNARLVVFNLPVRMPVLCRPATTQPTATAPPSTAD